MEAAIVKHNTSLFAELALRSLLASFEGGYQSCDLRVTVVDNHSTDDVEPRLDVAKDAGVMFQLSSGPPRRRRSTRTAMCRGTAFSLVHTLTSICWSTRTSTSSLRRLYR